MENNDKENPRNEYAGTPGAESANDTQKPKQGQAEDGSPLVENESELEAAELEVAQDRNVAPHEESHLVEESVVPFAEVIGPDDLTQAMVETAQDPDAPQVGYNNDEDAQEAEAEALNPPAPAPKAGKSPKTKTIKENPESFSQPRSKPKREFNINEFYEDNKKLVNYAALAILLLVGGYFLYKYMQAGKEEEATAALVQPEYLWEMDSMRMAIPGLQKVVDDYSGTKAANLAHYYLGTAFMQQDKYQDAIPHLEKFNAGGSYIFAPKRLGLLGDAYSQLKQYEKAADYYVRAANDNNNEMTTPTYRIKAAQVYLEVLNQPKKALDLYQSVKKDFGNTRVAQRSGIDKLIAKAQAKVDAGK